MDPHDQLADVTGLEFLQQMIDQNVVATMAQTLGFRLCEVADGYARFEGRLTEDHLNPAGVGHGGYAAAILDSALGCSIQTKLPKGTPYGTVELKINYIRPILPSGDLLQATGTAVHVGRRMGTSEARLVDQNGKLLAHGSTTCMIY